MPRHVAAGGLAALLLAATSPAALAGKTERVSVSSAGRQADERGALPGDISYGGRYVVFDSEATSLVAFDANGNASDVFVRDRKTGTTTLASVSSAGAQANGPSGAPFISRDGRFVLFQSSATNLVPNATSGRSQVYLRDRTAGTTALVSVGTRGEPADADFSDPQAISADGRYVAFASRAGNLVPGGGAGQYQLYVRDTATGTTTLESAAPDGTPGDDASFDAAITPDGRWLAFASEATNLVPGDTNGARDVFLRDRQARRTVPVSVARNGGPGDEYSDPLTGGVAVSDDGGLVAFASRATNLVAGDTNGLDDVFVRDVRAGTTERVSLAPGGGQADGDSFTASLTADGRHVAFDSNASNLVAGDTNWATDVFVRDRATGATVRASVSNAGKQGKSVSQGARLAAGGRFVLFVSFAANLVPGDTNGAPDAFVRRLLPASP